MCHPQVRLYMTFGVVKLRSWDCASHVGVFRSECIKRDLAKAKGFLIRF